MLEAKRREAAAASAERREHQDQYELMLKRRLTGSASTDLAATDYHESGEGYELAKQEEAAQYQQHQLVRQRQLEARTAALSPAERREARIVDWIRGGQSLGRAGG